MEAANEINKRIEDLNERFQKKEASEILNFFLKEYKGRIALSSSLGAEDQVLTQMAVSLDPEIVVFTLDTGRVFPETYDLIERTTRKYGINIQILFPDYQDIEKMVYERGINLFYKSVENRKLCCHIRKIEPLKRAFKNLDVWICGLRRDQSVTRFGTRLIEWDENNNLMKLNPLINWTEKAVWDYIRQHDIPYNELHDKGFPSIGCQPCTRAIKPGEDIRAGRWWWEKPEQKECGLHNKKE